MFICSSNLHNEGEKQIVSPNIKITMRENSYLGHTNYLGTTNKDFASGCAIEFKGYLVANHSFKQILYRFNSDLSGQTTFGISNIYSCLHSHFLNTGNTLSYFYVGNEGDTMNLYRLITIDGINWGNTELISKDVGIVTGIAPTANHRVYWTGYTKATTVGVGKPFRYNYLYYAHLGTAWNINKVNFNNFQYNEDQTDARNIIGYRIGQEDILILNMYETGSSFSWTKLESLSGYRHGIKILKSDGSETYSDFDLINTRIPPEDSILMSNLSIGKSEYYFCIRQVIGKFTKTGSNMPFVSGGATKLYDKHINCYLFKSTDMVHWSNPIFLYNSEGVRTYDPEGLFNNPPTVVAGTSNLPEFMILGCSQVLYSMKGASELDISDNIISYQNSNNERISLTIGNFK